MTLADLTAAPRILEICGTSYLASPPTLRDYGTIQAYLADTLETPEPPAMQDSEVRSHLIEKGRHVLLYVALRRDQPNLTIEDCVRLADSMDGPALKTLYDVVYRVRERPQGIVTLKDLETPERDSDVLLCDWAGGFEIKAMRRYRYRDIADLTLDQINNIITGGTANTGDDREAFEEAMRIYQETQELVDDEEAGI